MPRKVVAAGDRPVQRALQQASHATRAVAASAVVAAAVRRPCQAPISCLSHARFQLLNWQAHAAKTCSEKDTYITNRRPPNWLSKNDRQAQNTDITLDLCQATFCGFDEQSSFHFHLAPKPATASILRTAHRRDWSRPCDRRTGPASRASRHAASP